MTLKRLLVATDFSPAAGQALSMAAELARRFGATLQVVHVIDDVALMVAPGTPHIDLGGLQEEMKTEALVHLEVMLRRERLDVDATPVVLISGAPAEAILEHAEHSGADLLLAGTHGRSGWSGLLLGSVAQKLVRSARCPVLIAHAPELEMVPAPEQRRSAHVAAVGFRPKP